MLALSVLLWIKIIVTLIWVAAPLLLLPKKTIDRLSGFEPSDPSLYRLYAVAILALLVGYFGGYRELADGGYPYGVGIFSNAGAFLTLIVTGRARKTPIMAGFFGLVATGLILATLFED
jgi:hypothetical protein